MRRKKRYANDPLMYIQQPTIKRSGANMQHQYASKKKQVNETTQPSETSEKKIIQKRTAGNKFVQQLKSQDSKEDTKKSRHEQTQDLDKTEEDVDTNISTRPKFKDMSLREKVEYFAEKPKHLPKMKCEIKTKQRSYRGIVHEFEDDTVRMIVGRRIVSFSFDDIKEVKMLGL